jgi:hypothetical protein
MYSLALIFYLQKSVAKHMSVLLTDVGGQFVSLTLSESDVDVDHMHICNLSEFVFRISADKHTYFSKCIKLLF